MALETSTNTSPDSNAPGALGFLSQISRLYWLATALGVVILIIIYFLVVKDPELNGLTGGAYLWAAFLKLIEGVAPNIIAAFIGFVASYIVLRPIEALRARDRDAHFQANIDLTVNGAIRSVGEQSERNVTAAIQQQFRDMATGADGAKFISDFRDFDFGRHLRAAEEIFMATEFLGGWFEQSSTEFEAFLKRHGRLTIAIPNTANEQLVSFIAQ